MLKRVIALSVLAIHTLSFSNSDELALFFPMGTSRFNEKQFSGRARAETLTHFDKLLDWFLKPIDISYEILEPPIQKIFEIKKDRLQEFTRKYGYFSSEYPLIAKVTLGQEDNEPVQELFTLIHEDITDPLNRKIAIGESLSKVLAYRELKVGDRFLIPNLDHENELIAYVVDHRFDLWHEMPAFGLIPEKKGAPSLLIFRGTDLSLDRRSGWASVVSDFDLSGPGYSVFQNAREELSSWLKKVAKLEKKAAAFGFSLGGIMVMYMAIYEYEHLDLEHLMAFNPPGVNKLLLDQWQSLLAEERGNLDVFVNRKDPVSKWGYLIGNAYELNSENITGPIQAHNIFMNGQKSYTAFTIDILKENASR